MFFFFFFLEWIQRFRERFFAKNRNPDFKFEIRYFVSLLKYKERIIDPNDLKRRWILWIISKTGNFGYMTEVFLYHRSEKIEYCQR